PAEEFVRALTETPGKVPPTFLHHRGDPDQPRGAVAPGGLAVLDDALPLKVPDTPLPATGTTGRRLALAKWLTDPRHPLTARVLVNRVWMHHFGRGLVGSPGDFGKLGERPTHPELLDWLASDFVGQAVPDGAKSQAQPDLQPVKSQAQPDLPGGWDLKRLHRLLMISTAYRQSAQREAAAAKLDPDNRLLGRMSVR